MIEVIRSDSRGGASHGWLETRHSFSFADYYDPSRMGFRVLRVINEDRVAPGAGFPTHPHRDMEILTYVLDGALQHRDSMGNSSIIKPGEVQRMSAGTGVRHSEFNASKTEPVHFLQIWILPEKPGVAPGYAQTAFAPAERRGRLRLVASRDGAEGSVSLNQDLRLFASLLGPGQRVDHTFQPGRYGWIQVVSGEITAGDRVLSAGDGAALAGVSELVIHGVQDAEFLLFDLP
ncbi:MAG: pirin family protein [Myxococcales bacterium]|nr:pirin family protein [Myxococcales bacterium]